MTDGVCELTQSEGVAAAGAGLGDVGAVLGALPCSCGGHGCHDDRGGDIAWKQCVWDVWGAALKGSNSCMAGNSDDDGWDHGMFKTVILVGLIGMHKTGCSGETRLVLLVPSSS